jgi:hypothetical protein
VTFPPEARESLADIRRGKCARNAAKRTANDKRWHASKSPGRGGAKPCRSYESNGACCRRKQPNGQHVSKQPTPV